MTRPVVCFREVSFGYPRPERAVLKSVSFEVPEGAVTAVLGPNGAGKTTLLHLALGWLRPRSGEITLMGEPVQSYGQRERGRWMSLVPQKEHIPFEYSLLEYVMLGRAPYLRSLQVPAEEDRIVALDAIRSVGLGGMEERSINELSSGERQLLLVARSLAQRPRLLLLDEPTSHLDLHNKKRIVGILEEERRGNRTVLFSTHELDVASHLADHLVMIRGGEILSAGPSRGVLDPDALRELYGIEVRVLDVEGKKVALWL